MKSSSNNKANFKLYWYTLIFLPIFITPSGFYQSYVTENGLHLGDTGLVFPIYFFIGILLILYLGMVFIKQGYITLITIEAKAYLILLVILSFTLASMGFMGSSEKSTYVRCIQLITGGVGVGISWFLFEYKKFQVESFFGKLGIMYFFIILLNYAYSFSQIGISSIGYGLLPSLGLFDIYQTHVYYPFIITMICFMGLPYIIKKHNFFFLFYLAVYLLNVLSWQVRGAILSFLVMLLISFVIKFNFYQKVCSFFFLCVFVFSLIKFFGIETVIGRFANIEGVATLSGRTDIWSSVFKEFDLLKFLFGNFFIDKDGITAHNQYLQLFDQGGILLLLLFIVMLFNLAFIIGKFLFIDNLLDEKKSLIYYFLILLTQWIIDFNVNVPINNTNPAIFYWFYLNSILVLTYLKANTSQKEHINEVHDNSVVRDSYERHFSTT